MKAAEADMDKILEDRRKRYREASARSKHQKEKEWIAYAFLKRREKGGTADVGDYVQIILPFLKFEVNDKLVELS